MPDEELRASELAVDAEALAEQVRHTAEQQETNDQRTSDNNERIRLRDLAEKVDTEAQALAQRAYERASAIDQLRKTAELQNQNIAELTKGLSLMASALDRRPTKRDTLGLIGVMMVVNLVIVSFLFFTSIRNQKILIDCTTPSTKTEIHLCSDRAKQQTNVAVGNLGLIIIDAQQCQTDRQPDIKICVERKLAEQGVNLGG